MLDGIKKMAGKPGRLIAGLVLASVVALAAGAFVFSHVFPENAKGLSAGVLRVKNYFSFAVLGDKPNFYYLDGEKNGREIRLTGRDRFEVTYRDEFVIKSVTTDDIFGGGVTVDVEGTGQANDLGRLLRGVELVDKAALSPVDRPYHILIRYHDATIAEIPVAVVITAQDWLRYARGTEDVNAKIRYLERAIALNKEDIPVRRMLVSVYEKAGRKEAAAAQLKEIAAMGHHDMAAPEQTAAARIRDEGPAAGAPVYYEKGLAFSKAGDWAQAIASYLEALKQDPDNGPIRYKLGEAYEKSNQTGEAIKQYGLVLAKNPQAEYAMMALADVSLKARQYPEAIKWYGELIKRRPREASLYGNLGLAYGGKGMADEEIRQYKKALALNPRNTTILYNLGAAYEKGKNDREAAKAYRQVLKIRPADADAPARLAGIEFRGGNYAEAIKIYEKIVKKADNKAGIYANLGFAYGEKKDYRKSADCYEKAIKNGNKDPQVKTNLGYAYNRMKSGKTGGPATEKAAVIEKAAAPVRKSPNRQIDRYVKEKKYGPAIAEYKKIIRKDPKNARYHEGLGDVYGLKGDTDRQIASYLMSLKYGKANDGVYTRLGEAYEKKGRLQDALNAYNRAYEINPDLSKAGRRITQLKIKLLEQKHRDD